MRWKFWSKKENAAERVDRLLRESRQERETREAIALRARHEDEEDDDEDNSEPEEDMPDFSRIIIHFNDGEAIEVIYNSYDDENYDNYVAYYEDEDQDEEFLRIFHGEIRYIEVKEKEQRKPRDIEYGFKVIKPKVVRQSSYETPTAKPSRLKEIE